MAQNKMGNSMTPSLSSNSEERFIGVIPDAYKWTMFGGKDRFNIVVTDKRLIFDLITDKTLPWGEYGNRRVEEVIAFNKKNFAIEISQLKSFKFVSGENVDHLCNRHEEIDGQMQFQTPKAKYTFYIPVRYVRTAREVLSQAGLNTKEEKKEYYLKPS